MVMRYYIINGKGRYRAVSNSAIVRLGAVPPTGYYVAALQS